MSKEVENTYKIRPNFKDKFRPATVKSLIHNVLHEELAGKQYNSDECTLWSKKLSEMIKGKIKDLKLDRYKILVQVVIGEQKGEGVKVACRCLWDSDTDNYAQDIFMTDTFFCVASVYGVYHY
ncbi:dynein light chain Tctex-type protein 2B-like [Xenia sp. Carnegie-2017]|uniref:dynein light chain Tctex-type protein 2B-like n=1 Tax=Xenia sp. Carnegie-2017 TaxID=2897299 RepID=UPI001F036EDD|nr:dynein light chain Tctex-type protein 2B-like [Xenia sp. Carnegie-2017]